MFILHSSMAMNIAMNNCEKILIFTTAPDTYYYFLNNYKFII